MPSHNDYLKKFNRCILEYTNAAGAFDLTEAGEEDNIAPVQSADDPTAGADMGGMDAGGDMSMGGAPNAGAPDMGADPSAGSAPDGEESPAEPPQGFSPQGEDSQTGMDGMGGQPMSQDGDSDDEEVIDVDDLTKSQEKAEEKIDRMNARFDKLMQSIEVLIQQNKERDEREAERERNIEDEINKRIPTPMQRLTMRSTKSAPYAMSPEEYMNNYAPENYSAADDNNGADDPQYKITKADIDNFTDYNSIAKDLDIEHQDLRNILGY